MFTIKAAYLKMIHTKTNKQINKYKHLCTIPLLNLELDIQILCIYVGMNFCNCYTQVVSSGYDLLGHDLGFG